MENINFEEFLKVDMRIGKILSAEKIENSEKLLKLEVDFGLDLGQRQIISGIAKSYAPDFLTGKSCVFVVNLEPKEIMGLQSNGMILCASINGLPVILNPEKDVLPGTKIK